MSLVKTKRDVVPAGPGSITGAEPGLDDLLAQQGTEQAFRSLEAELRGEVAEEYPSRWIDVADYDPADQRWIVHGLDLLVRNAAAAGPGFDGLRASSLLVDLARDRRFDPGISDRRFMYEVLTLSGWLETALPAALSAPTAPALTRLAEIYRAPASDPFDPAALTSAVLPALTDRLAEQRTWWVAEPVEMEDLTWIERTARSIQAFVRDDTGLFTGACAEGPLNDGFTFDGSVIGAGARPGDDTTRMEFLRRQVHLIGRDPSYGSALDATGYDHTRVDHRGALDDLLLTWLAGDTGLSGLVGEMLGHTPAHRSGPTGWIYIPALLPSSEWGPQEAWRPYLYRAMLHELLHRLAHPGYVEKVDMVSDPQILEEGIVDLLTTEFLELSRIHPELGALVPEDVSVGYGTSGRAAIEIQDLVGPDNVKAAFFLGRTEFIGLA
ncbi:hypothetical protein [Streptosporangium roseum]|uniref:hypothetical protein n=1 Tax=Streptosporangium roseum TaxID=2001 RepID=UPI003318BF77